MFEEEGYERTGRICEFFFLLNFICSVIIIAFLVVGVVGVGSISRKHLDIVYSYVFFKWLVFLFIDVLIPEFLL